MKETNVLAWEGNIWLWWKEGT